MFRKTANALWFDEGAFNRAKILRCGHLVREPRRTSGSTCFSSLSCRPHAKRMVSAADKELIEQYGAAVVECSWVRVKEVPWGKIGGKCERLC